MFSNLQKDLSNGVLHAPIGDDLTPALKVFVVGNQIGIELFFYHNLFIFGLNG
jgi:hypothetical protein